MKAGQGERRNRILEEWGTLREKRDAILENRAKGRGGGGGVDLFRQKIEDRKSRPKIVMINFMGQG